VSEENVVPIFRLEARLPSAFSLFLGMFFDSKMEATIPPKRPFTHNGLQDIISRKIELFINTVSDFKNRVECTAT
jgi:hypothetical protein